MKLSVFIPVLALFSFLIIWGCKNSTSNNTPPPPKVMLVEKSSDSSAVETGIDAEDPANNADPVKNGIIIQWHPVDYEKLKAYDVYRRAIDTTGGFQKIAVVDQSFNARDTIYLDQDVNLDTIYYYYIIARNEEGGEGEPSAKDHYTLYAKVTLNSPINSQLFDGTNGSFQWTFFSGIPSQYFIFRLEKQGVTPGEYIPYALKLLELTNYTNQQTWTLAEIGLTSLGQGTYRWRIDVRDFTDNRKGSESGWGQFEVQ
jgi:hypothetical protein